MLREILHFFANLVEVIAALAAILSVALLITMAALWILPKIFGVTEEPLEDSDLDQEEEFIPLEAKRIDRNNKTTSWT